MNRFTAHLLTGLGAVILFSQQVNCQSVSLDGRILSTDDDFTYNNPNDHYKPNQYVKFGHWMSRNSDFETNVDYIINAAYMPAILAGCGILAFLLINLFFFFRCCCKCVACLPDETEEKYKTKRLRVLLAFYFVLFCALAFDQLMFLGNHKIAQSVTTLQNSIDYVGNIADSVINDAAQMVTYGGDMINEAVLLVNDVNDCPYAQSLGLDDYLNTVNSTAYDFTDQSNTISSKTDDVDKFINKAHDYVDKYGNEYRFKVICAIWLISVLAVLLIIFTHMCRAKCVMQTALLYVWIVFLIYIVIGAIWGIFVTTMGTFCMKPLYTLNKLAPSGDFRNYTMYYSACQGEGVIQSLINTAVNQITDLNNTLTNITNTAVANDYNTNCPNNNLIADIQSFQSTLTDVVVTIQDVEYQTGCESVQQVFFDVINTGWCTEWYSGVFYIWGSMLWTNFFLFLSVLVASYVWQYYAFWNGVPVTEVNHDFEEVNAPKGEEDSDEDQQQQQVDPERQVYFESPHTVTATDPYANPDAHSNVVIPAEVVYISSHGMDEGHIAMVEMATAGDRDSRRDSSKKKKGPKKAKRSSGNEYDEVDTEAQL